MVRMEAVRIRIGLRFRNVCVVIGKLHLLLVLLLLLKLMMVIGMIVNVVAGRFRHGQISQVGS